MGQIVGEIQKNALEKVVVSVSEFRGKTRIDLRIYYQPDQTEPDKWLPTKKGINLDPEGWKEPKGFIHKVDQAIGQTSQTKSST